MKFLMLLILSLTANVQAQSLLQNGTFDQDLNSWDNPNLTATWISNDGAAASGNGSIQFGSNQNNGASVWVRSELMPTKEAYRYIMATSFKRPDDSVANGMSMSVFWYDDQGNQVGEYPWDQFFDISQADIWHDFDYAFENIVEGGTQARVYLWVIMPIGGVEQSYGLFDDVIFFQDTVFVSDFD